ncbi:MAG: hypothetical protein JW720_09105 [Sedimentisphaerales bacterium]|nr:hypothetical protein [Sedimentisphaerales bacterium]
MERVVFAESWREFFSGAGFESFDDFFDYPGGEKIGSNRRRSVYRIKLGREEAGKVFYIKRFNRSHLKDILGAWLTFGGPTSQAKVEWANANLLLETGIETYRPVCMGERTALGIESRSFVITEQLNATCLLDFVIAKWQSLDRAAQEKIIRATALLARRAHDANISLQDLYIWHYFIQEDSLDGDCRLSVIDLHRMLQNVKSAKKKLMDLAALYWSMSGNYFDEAHKNLLVTAYLGGEAGAKSAEAFSAIRRRASILDKRRNLADHYAKAMRAMTESA